MTLLILTVATIGVLTLIGSALDYFVPNEGGSIGTKTSERPDD